jgi:hypothetical protein
VFTSSSSFAFCLPICSIHKFKILHATTRRLFLLSSLQTPETGKEKTEIEFSFLLQCSCKFASKKAPKNHRSFML